MNIYSVGLKWDIFTSAVKGQITRDLIALKNETSVEVVVFCGEEAADLIQALNMRRMPLRSTARLWILYHVNEQQLDDPENATTVIHRDLYVGDYEIELDDRPRVGYYLKPGDRIIAPTLNLNKLGPARGGRCDPMIQILWG